MYKPDKSMHWMGTSGLGLCVTAWCLSSTLLPQPGFRKVRVANTDARFGAGCQGHVNLRCLLEKAQVRADRWHVSEAQDGRMRAAEQRAEDLG